MARYTGPSCRICRREGTKLYLKGQKCFSSKCVFERKGYKPGQFGANARRGRRPTDYALQLREKQKMKSIYDILEKQFRRYVMEAERREEVAGEVLLQLLERRLDNVVYRAGFARSRSEARQIISHRHIMVNDHIVNVASYQVRAGDVVKTSEKSSEIGSIVEAKELSASMAVPEWLQVDLENGTATVVTLPQPEQINVDADEQQVIEFYSR